MSVENAFPIRQKFFSHVDFVTCCHHLCKLLIQKKKHLYRCCYSQTLILATMFQLCINESLFISLVILQKPQCENIRKSNILRCGVGFYCVILSSHKRCESSNGFSHPDLRYHGVSGSLHVGLAVNISGLLYMVCCRVPPTWVFCFPPSCVELMSKPFCQGEFSPHSLTSVSWGLEQRGFSALAGYAVVSFLLNGIPFDNATNLLSKLNVAW